MRLFWLYLRPVTRSCLFVLAGLLIWGTGYLAARFIEHHADRTDPARTEQARRESAALSRAAAGLEVVR